MSPAQHALYRNHAAERCVTKLVVPVALQEGSYRSIPQAKRRRTSKLLPGRRIVIAQTTNDSSVLDRIRHEQKDPKNRGRR